MKNNFLLYTLFCLLAFTSCKDDSEENVVSKDDITSSTDIKTFTSSVFSQMDSPMALVEFRLDNVLADAGVSDGSVQKLLPAQISTVANFYINAITNSLDLTTPSYFIIDDFDSQKGQLSQGMGILKIGNKEAFQSFINENGVPSEVNGYGFMDLEKVQIAWKNDVAIIGYSNTTDGSKYVQKMMENGLKGKVDEKLANHLIHEDDIHVYIPGKEVIQSIYDQQKEKLNADADKAVTTILKDIEESNLSIAVNFENGKIELKALNNISDKLKPLVDILSDKGVSLEKINSVNTDGSVGQVALKLDAKKFSNNFSKYVFDNNLLDENFKSQSQMIDQMLTGDVVFTLDNVQNDKPKGIALVGTKTVESRSMVQMILSMQGIQSKSNNEDILFMVNNETWTKSQNPEAPNKILQEHAFAGSFNAKKLNSEDMDPILKQVLPNIDQIEFSGNFLELNGTLNGSNKEENILKTIISQAIKIMMEKNGLASN